MRSRFLFALGAILILIGAYLALRPLVGAGGPVTNSRVLDMAFAAFFLIRGFMNVRAARRPLASRGPGATSPRP